MDFQERIGDPLFYCNSLLGLLVNKRGADNRSIYLSVNRLRGLRTIIKFLADPPIEGEPNFTVNNPF